MLRFLDGPDRFPWMDQAACVGKPVELFFAVSPKLRERAKTVCARCPVLSDCREDNDRWERATVGAHAGYGVFGGETPEERSERRRGDPRKLSEVRPYRTGAGHDPKMPAASG